MMSDKIGIMLDGKLCQYDDVKTVYNEPVSSQVAEFLGHVNIIPPKCFDHITIDRSQIIGGSSISVRAEAIELSHQGDCHGMIAEVVFAGQYIMYHVRLDDITLVVYSFNPDFTKGDRVSVKINHYIYIREN